MYRTLDFYYDRVDAAAIQRRVDRINTDILKIAGDPLLGKSDKNVPGFLYWYAHKTDYRIYFERLGPTSIKVYRVWPSRSRSITLDDVRE